MRWTYIKTLWGKIRYNFHAMAMFDDEIIKILCSKKYHVRRFAARHEHNENESIG